MAISSLDVKPGVVIEAWFNNVKSIIIVNKKLNIVGDQNIYNATAIVAGGKIINFTLGTTSEAFFTEKTRILPEEEAKMYKLLYGVKGD